jgi:hypothetical protein
MKCWICGATRTVRMRRTLLIVRKPVCTTCAPD